MAAYLQNQNNTTPWYMNLPIYNQAMNESEPANPLPMLDFDPVEAMHHEKIGQSDRLLNHTSKALLTRTALERAQSRGRQEDIQTVRNHLVQFCEEPFGNNHS